MKNQDILKKITLVIAGMTAVLITILTIKFGEGSEILIVTPLYISICVLFLQSGVNRWAFLIGALNSLLYAAVYVYDGIYLSAASAALFSFPVQLVTFIRWKNRDTSGKTVFYTLSAKKRILITMGFIAAFSGFYALTRYYGSEWGAYDCFGMLMGILVTILCAVPYVEYSPLQCLNVLVTAIMFARMAQSNPIQYTYLAYNIYCLFCVIQALVRILGIYKKQKAEQNNTKS